MSIPIGTKNLGEFFLLVVLMLYFLVLVCCCFDSCFHLFEKLNPLKLEIFYDFKHIV